VFFVHRCKRLAIPVVAMAVVAQTLSAGGQSAQDQGQGVRKRSVTVEDAVEMTQVVIPALFSSNGERFLVVLRKANLEENLNQFSVFLYRTGEVFEETKPVLLLTMSSSSDRDAVHSVRWLRDNKTIVFLGENPGEMAQIYSFDVETRVGSKLTSSPTAITDYDVSADGRQMIYAADPPTRDCPRTPESRNMEIIPWGEELPEFFSSFCSSAPDWRSGQQLFLKRQGQPAEPLPIDDCVADWSETLKMSPDGRYAVAGVLVRQIPQAWAGYRDARLQQLRRIRRAEGKPVSGLERYLLVDVQTKSVSPLLDTPLIGFRPFEWAADSGSVFLKNVYLPLDVKDPTEREERSRNTHDVEVLLPSKDVRKIVGANTVDKETSEGPIRIEVRQDLNQPPRVYAVDRRDGRSRILVDPNPSFASLNLGTVEVIDWPTSDGRRVQGQLYRPVDFVPQKRYPLIIQTHAFFPHVFWMDGPWGGAYAARPLAARGFLVLQVGYDHSVLNTLREGPSELASFEGAIQYLDERGLVDRGRVGITGFSRTVFHVEYALTHSRDLFAAANLVDGIDAGYLQYLAFGAGDNVLLNGGDPFTGGFEPWLANSPTFNLGNVQAAIRLEAHGRSEGILGVWEWFAGLSEMNRPVELAYLPDAPHILEKPMETWEAEEAMVDWFCFWLKGEIDPSPRKEPQYRRWRRLMDDSRKAGLQSGH
jgi:dipeptidyl aminopeptidase/acylaminoacyl peptidase